MKNICKNKMNRMNLDRCKCCELKEIEYIPESDRGQEFDGQERLVEHSSLFLLATSILLPDAVNLTTLDTL